MADPEYLRAGLVGWPLGHSLSPEIHREFLASCGIPGEYELYPIRPERFAEELEELLQTGVRGLNVTFPYKAMAVDACDRVVTGTAQPVINTICVDDEGTTGYNTDTHGFESYIDSCGLEEPFFLAGSGGAALSVDGALRKRDMECRIFCRRPGAWGGYAEASGLDELDGAAESCGRGTLVNATTLGWRDGDPFPVRPSSLLGMAFADLNYNRGWAYRNSLENNGIRVFTGLVMLVCQAAGSFELWTGILPDTRRVVDMLEGKKEVGEAL